MWQSRTVWIFWAAAFWLAIACFALFARGLVRDTRASDPVLTLDFSSSTPGWADTTFRVWGQTTYDLLISMVNHNPALVGRSIRADFEVEVLNPDRRTVLQRRVSGAHAGIYIPMNYGDLTLATLQLDGSMGRSWTLRVRVLSPDSELHRIPTQVKLYKRYDPGMGGLMNYVMIIPAGVLLLVALGLAVSLARRGFRVPLLLTAAVAILLLLLPSLA